MGFTFRYGPKVVGGATATATIAAHLPQGPVLFVTDARLRELGVAQAGLAALQGEGREVVIFDTVEADPSETTVLGAVEAGRRGRVASVVGLGGGSPMDVAKLAALLLGSGEAVCDVYGVDRARGPRLPLVLVPTTAGTGSEATGIAIITVGGAEKRGAVSPLLVADLAILDPLLTLDLPLPVTAATGIDAMVHAVEAYTSARLKNPISDALAREALRLLAANLPVVCRAGRDLGARSAMLLGAHLAGVAFANAPVGGVHALAYPLGGHFHVPHGHANALMLGPVLGHNLAAAAPLYAELLDCVVPGHPAVGEGQRARAFVDELKSLCAATGLPLRLRDVGVAASDLARLAADSQKQERLLVNNPVPISEADAHRLYAEVL
ncbi:iron-containing alcohol dehydrogenase [Thermaurantiacus sp.]